MSEHRIISRRICWPNPDATCLEGGCGYCNFEDFKKLSVIEAYARSAEPVPNRYGGETQKAWDAYMWGLERQFCNAEVRWSE